MTQQATEVSFEEKFIQDHCCGSYAVNAYELFQNYGQYCYQLMNDATACEGLRKDGEQFVQLGVPDTFKYLDLHILVLKNEYVVIGISSPARNEEYTREFGMRRALRNAVEEGYGFIGFKIKEDRAEVKTVDNIVERRCHPYISETHSSIFSNHQYLVANLNIALGTIFGFENIQSVLNNVDLCVMWLPNGFKSVGHCQELQSQLYKTSINRISAISMASINLLPYLKYHHLNQ